MYYCQNSIWMFPKIGVPQNGWFIMENHIKMDDLGIPLFLEKKKTYIGDGRPASFNDNLYINPYYMVDFPIP